MAESDPKIAPQDWFAVRKRNARAGLRKLVEIVSESRTDRAEGPLPLHKSVYMGEARHAAEMEHIFRNEPIVAGLSGDIPKTGDTLVFDSVGPSILVTRGKDGVARAFLNMCTHRGGRSILQAAMRADEIVVVTPGVQELLRFADGHEDVAVETFVAQLAVEAFDEGILHRSARPNEIETDVVGIGPRIHRAADELAAVVDGNGQRGGSLLQYEAERRGDLDAGERSVGD